MKHPLLTSRVFRCSDEAINVNWNAWSPGRIAQEYTDSRLVAAHQRDGLRGFGIFPRKDPQPNREKIIACKGILSSFGCLPGTSFYLSGACHAGEEEHNRIYRGEKTKDFIDYHLEILDMLGTLIHHPGFAYAPDLESKGSYDIEQKKAVQAEFVAAVRSKYPDLAIILTAGGYGNPEDILEYGSMPAKGCMLRWCMYLFPTTHGIDRGFKSPIPYPLTQKDADRLKLDITDPKQAWKKEELQNAVGFNRTSVRNTFRKMKATGLPLVCQEFGYDRMNSSAVPYARAYHSDIESVAWSEGMSVFAYSMGATTGGSNRYGLNVGLDPSHPKNIEGRVVAGLPIS